MWCVGYTIGSLFACTALVSHMKVGKFKVTMHIGSPPIIAFGIKTTETSEVLRHSVLVGT